MVSQPTTHTDRLIRRTEVEDRTGLCRSSIYDKLSASSRYFDSSFPRPVSISGRSVAWVESEIDGWIAKRIASRPPVAAISLAESLSQKKCQSTKSQKAGTSAGINGKHDSLDDDLARFVAGLEASQRRPLSRKGSRA